MNPFLAERLRRSFRWPLIMFEYYRAFPNYLPFRLRLGIATSLTHLWVWQLHAGPAYIASRSDGVNLDVDFTSLREHLKARVRERKWLTAAGRRMMLLAYIHHTCGKPAFLLRRRPRSHDPLRSADASHLDGRPIEPGSEIRCDSCGARIDPFGLKTDDVTEAEIAVA